MHTQDFANTMAAGGYAKRKAVLISVAAGLCKYQQQAWWYVSRGAMLNFNATEFANKHMAAGGM